MKVLCIIGEDTTSVMSFTSSVHSVGERLAEARGGGMVPGGEAAQSLMSLLGKTDLCTALALPPITGSVPDSGVVWIRVRIQGLKKDIKR